MIYFLCIDFIYPMTNYSIVKLILSIAIITTALFFFIRIVFAMAVYRKQIVIVPNVICHFGL